MAAKLTRRTFVGLVAAAGGAALSGCGTSPGNETGGTVESNTATPQRVRMAVYRDPNCGCCEEWAAIARKAGYDVTLVDHPNMSAIKRQHGVPEELSSCHTALLAGYVIEGHVPLGDVDRLLEGRPTGIKGLAVPGMPRGSPGMEVPGGAKDPFQVLAFDAAGKSSLFASSAMRPS